MVFFNLIQIIYKQLFTNLLLNCSKYFLLLLFLSSLFLFSIDVKSIKKIGIRDQAVITVKFSQDNATAVIVSDDFINMGRRSSSTSISIINGKYSKETIETYILKPKKKGSLTFKIKVGNETAGPFKMEVVEKSIAQNNNRSPRNTSPTRKNPFFDPFGLFNRSSKTISKNAILIENTITKRNLFINEIAVLNTILYFDPAEVTIEDINLEKNFSHFGLNLIRIKKITPTSKNVSKKGRTYKSQIIMKHLIYPIHPGKHSIKDGKFIVRKGGSFFNQGQSLPILTPALSVNTKEHDNGNAFYHHFGDFKLEATLSTNEVNLNEPITLTIKVKGQGNFKTLNSPLNLSKSHLLSPYIRIKKGTIEDLYEIGNSTFVGEKVYQYYIIPEKVGDIKLEPIVFTSYSPSKKKIVVKTKKLPILHIRSDRSIPTTSLIRSGLEVVNKEIRYIETILPKPNFVTSTLGLFAIYHLLGSLVFILFSISKKQKLSFRNFTQFFTSSSNQKIEKQLIKMTSPHFSLKEIIPQLKDLLVIWSVSYLADNNSKLKTKKQKKDFLFNLKRLNQNELIKTIKEQVKNMGSYQKETLMKVLEKINTYDGLFYSDKIKEFDLENEVEQLKSIILPSKNTV